MQVTEGPDGQLSGNVMLYVRPEPLNPETHGKMGVRSSPNPYRFAAKAHAVPLQVSEFGPAAINYPIIFAGESKQPMAILSIRQNESLFISEDGYFEPSAYIPAYLRRFPFVLADDPSNERLIVCVDVGTDVLVQGGELALFDGAEATDFTKSAIEFCTNYEGERRRTESFIQLLQDHELFELKEAFFNPTNPDGSPGEPVRLADYFAVSEEKMRALPADKLVELRDSGALAMMYAQLVSLNNWDKLVARTMMKDEGQLKAANA